ncbi:MAG: hypothetical protein HDR19_03640 [Lachnospiraceae bacterium]|nr:hypothetical protein [Lachnospiraceae bacterium]
MSIEAYTTFIMRLYGGLFLLVILIGAVEAWNRIRKKTRKYWLGIIPYSILYLISAVFSTFIAFIAYDDPSDPNYARYENWGLHDFILHDIKTFILWLFIGILLYLAFGSKSTKKSIKMACIILLGFFIILLGLMFLWLMIQSMYIIG